MSLTRKWSLMAAVLSVAILVAGWFLLVSPRHGEAASLREQAVAQDDANARLLQQLEVLKAQQAELPQQRAKLAVMQTQIPDNPALPTLVRDLTAAGRRVGVSIDAMTPATPVALVTAQPVAPAPATTETTGTEGGEAAATPPAPVAAPPSLYQVPLTLEVSGSYFELEQFVNKLEGLKRSFLVTGFTLSENKAAEAASTTSSSGAAAPGPAPGDLLLSLQGRVFLSPAAAAPTTVQPTPAATAATGQ